MDIQFSVKYETAWGEEVFLVTAKKAFPMEYSEGGLWHVVLTGRDIRDAESYHYEIQRDGDTVRREWHDHLLRVPAKGASLLVRDRWLAREGDSPFWSQAFSEVIFRRPDGADFRHPREAAPVVGNVLLEVTAPEVRSSETVAITGSGKALGNWKKVLPLDDGRFPWWTLSLEVKERAEYKFVIIDTRTKVIKMWEEGPNRVIPVPAKGSATVVSDIAPKFPTRPWRGAGTAVPVFSLRTEDSFGVGEFHDIKKLVDWAVATGQNIIQLLPVNDTTMSRTWQDSYPYNAVSSFALHPQFVHLPDAGVRCDKHYRELRKELNDLDKIDYERVGLLKGEYLRKAYSAKALKDVETPEYQKFVADNTEWLIPYAAFSVLRDEYGTCDFSQWGKYSTYNPRTVEKYIADHTDDVGFYVWVQYLLDAQLKDAVSYAHRHGVAIKGDLPIGVSRISVDAWRNPGLFHLDSQAGAPPDAFAVDGQNWGFPTYNWEKMAEDGFAWWKARMRKMSDYFDAYRIDHILGFFRIWEIPAKYTSGLMGHFSPALPYSTDELRNMGFDPRDTGDKDCLFVEDPRRAGYWHPRISGTDTRSFEALSDWQKGRYRELYEDFFYHRHNDFWKGSAMAKLPSLVESTGMLTCGEDLGMIPACVPDTMAELGILSLEIQRMPKDPAEEFARPETYPYMSVCATGTHDTSPLRAWWEEDRGLSQRFYNSVMGEWGDAPYFCEPWVVDKIISAHMHSPSMLAILPLQDWLATDGEVRYQGNPADERINVPAIPRYYWRYRMHCTLESLIANESLNAHIRSLVEDGGRNV